MDAPMNDTGMPATKGDLSLVKQDVLVLKQDVSVLKQDVSVLKQDVSVLKQDVPKLGKDLVALESRLSARLDGHDQKFDRIDAHLLRLSVGYTQFKGDLWDFRTEFRQALEAQSSLLLGRMDRILTAVEDFKLQWAFHEGMLQNHEGRIKRLELKA